MNYNNYDNSQIKKQVKPLPMWFWVLTIVMLILCILFGYLSGSISRSLLNKHSIQDTNGTNTSLNTLDFNTFIEYENYTISANKVDAQKVFMTYVSNRKTNSDGQYSNYVFSNKFSATNSFNYLSGYDICAVLDNPGTNELLFETQSNIKSGNYELRIMLIKDTFTLIGNDSPKTFIDPIYIETIFSAQANEKTSIVISPKSGYIYVIAVAAETASGTYKITIDIA